MSYVLPRCGAGASKLFCEGPDSKELSFVDDTLFVQGLNTDSTKAL